MAAATPTHQAQRTDYTCRKLHAAEMREDQSCAVLGSGGRGRRDDQHVPLRQTSCALVDCAAMGRLAKLSVLIIFAAFTALWACPRDACAAGPDRAKTSEYSSAGLPIVALAYHNASDDYREAINAAITEVDPEDLRPWWRHELWRICWRESKCGRFGVAGVHESDRWVGSGAYLWAVYREQLAPLRCPAHRLADYSPVLRALTKWEREHRQRPRVRAFVSSLETGTRTAGDFATRGGWGMGATRVRRLGSCVAPEVLDDPRQAARLAALTLASCERGRGEMLRPCSCSEHTQIWVGAGRLRSRPLFALVRDADGHERKSRHSTVRKQCGSVAAQAYVFAELLASPGRFAAWVARR